MIIERAKNTKRNIVYGLLNSTVHIVVPFVLRTVIIYTLGIEYVGINSLFTSILSILSLSELGFDSSVVFVMYKGVANNDRDQLDAMLLLMKRVYRIIGLVILALGSLCIPFLGYLIEDISTLPPEIDVVHIYLVFLLNTTISYFFGGYRNCLLRAYQRDDVVANTNAVVFTIFSLLQLGVLLVCRNYYYYLYLLPACSIANNLMVVHRSKKMFPQIVPEGRVRKEDLAILKRQVAGTFLSRLGNVLCVHINGVVVSAFLGVRVLAYYSNYSYITTTLIGALWVVNSSLRGGLGNSLILESKEKNIADFKKLNFLYSWLIGWVTYCVIFLTQPFMRLWIGEEGMLPDYIVVLLGISMYQGECYGILHSYKVVRGLMWEDRYRPILTGLSDILIKLGLIMCLSKYGSEAALAGIVTATVLSSTFVSNPWTINLICKKYFTGMQKEVTLRLSLYLLVMLVACLVSVPIFRLIPVTGGANGAVNICVRAVLCLVLPNLLFLMAYGRTRTFKEAREFIVARMKS